MTGVRRGDEHDVLVESLGRDRLEGFEVDQPDRDRECVSHAARRRVGVGVSGVQTDPGPDQPMQQGALEGCRGDRVDSPQQQRVMGHDEVRAPGDRLVDDGLDRVDREQHAAHGLRRVARDQSHGIPGLGSTRRVAPVEHTDDVGERGRSGLVVDHLVNATCRAAAGAST
jgi:hypothetical protein